MNAKIFFGFILSFTVGVALESLLGFGYSFAVFLLALGLVLLLSLGVSRRESKSFFVSLLFIACALGVGRTVLWEMKHDVHSLDMFLSKSVTIEGLVDAEPDKRDEYTNIVLDVGTVLYEDDQEIIRDTKVLVRVPHYPEYMYGDELVLSGKLVSPKNFTDDARGRVFDYRAYLKKDGIYYQIFFPKIENVTHGSGNIMFEKLFAFKARCLDRLKEALPEPESSLAGGILLGAKESLGGELLQKFRETGLSHIVVLSGYNIAIVVSAVSLVLSRLSFGLRIFGGALGVILFAVMVGGGATVVRATIMILVVLIARAFGREGDALRALVLTGGVMVFANPSILFHDVSFQLSFMATLALVLVSPIIEPYFKKISSPLFREIVVSTITTQILVLPLILYHMGSVSFVGTLANILVLPVMPLAMLLSAFVIALGAFPFIGSLASWVAYGALAYITLVAEKFSALPLASFSDISFPLTMLVFTYVCLGVWILKKFPREK